MSCAVAPGPIIIDTGSPGTTRISTKTTRATPKSVGTTRSSRRTRTGGLIVAKRNAAPGATPDGPRARRGSVAGRPEARLRGLLVGHALGIADQLELHAPGRENVGDRLAGGRTFLDREWAHEGLQAIGLGLGDGLVDVLDVEGQVVAAVVAVLRLLGALARRAVLEEF